MKIKILSLILTVVMLLFTLTVPISAEEGIGWYVKRNGSLRPEFSQAQKSVQKYGGYFIDNRVTDTSTPKILYLTFDSGYENGNTEIILDTLKEKNVKAAFFVLNHLILKNTDLVKRMSEDGHLVCNHTSNHKDLTKLTREDAEKCIRDLEKIYEQKTSLKLAPYFRFPEGKYSMDTLKLVNELGYKTVFWSFAYEDWDNEKQMPPEKAYKKIIENTHNGAVILLHPTSKTNAEIIGKLIDEWRDMGYEFGTLDDLTKAR